MNDLQNPSLLYLFKPNKEHNFAFITGDHMWDAAITIKAQGDSAGLELNIFDTEIFETQ